MVAIRVSHGGMHAQVANAYGAGLTDWDQSSLYGKLCIFAFAAWGGHNDGVIAGLAVCGIMLSVTSAACGELTLQNALFINRPCCRPLRCGHPVP